MFKHFKKACILLMSLCMLFGLSIFLAACGESKDPPAAVDMESILYDGKKFTWAAAKGATSYKITINDLYTDRDIGGATTFSYTHKAENEYYDFSIIAVNQYGESATTSKQFRPLETIDVSSITFNDEGEMSWEPVDGATSYLLNVNGKEVGTNVTSFSDFVYGGQNNVQIKPVGGSDTFAAWSGNVSAYFLAAPTNISYDGQKLRWTGDNNASGYDVYINGAKKNASLVPDVNWLFDSGEVSFTVSVQSMGDSANHVFPSKKSEEIKYTYLQKVTNVEVKDGALTWQPITDAVKYNIHIAHEGGTVETDEVTKPEYQLTAGVPLTVSIQPVGSDPAHTFSVWSDEHTYTVMAAPSLIWDDTVGVDDGQEHGNFSWSYTNMAGVSAFAAKIVTPDGKATSKDTGKSPLLSYAFSEVGVYKVSVKVVAEPGSGMYDSAYSAEWTIIRLSAPVVSKQGGITSDPSDLTKGFTVSFAGVSGATRYRLWRGVGGSLAATEIYSQFGSNSIDVKEVTQDTQTEVENLTFSLQSIGSDSDDRERTVTLSSITSQNSSFSITVLPMPRNLEINGTRLSWTSVSSARGYAVKVGTIRNAEDNNYDLAAITEGEKDVQVCARGDGANVLPSPYTAALKVNKLLAPAWISVGTSEQEGVIDWEKVDHAQSFNFYFGDDNTPVDNKRLENISAYISQRTVAVRVEAVANYWSNDESKNVYYLSSDRSLTYTFTRLAAPTFGARAFTNSQLVWNAPSNANSAAITYVVYDANNRVKDLTPQGTSLNISTLEGGREYSFSVQAISTNGRCNPGSTAFINSELSDVQRIWKLATPQVTRDKTVYKWTAINRATAYEVRIDGKRVATIDVVSGQREYTHAPSFGEIKPSGVSVEIVAVGNGGVADNGALGTIDSKPWETNQVVKRLDTPTLNRPTYSGNTDNQITATLKQAVANATGYRFSANGVIKAANTKDLSCTFKPTGRGKFTISVVALGGAFDEDGVFYIDSLAAGGNDLTAIVLLGAPSANSIRCSDSGNITWGEVDECNEFKLKIHYRGEADAVEVTARGLNYDAFGLEQDGKHKVSDITYVEIQAVGEDQSIGGDNVFTYSSEFVQNPRSFS